MTDNEWQVCSVNYVVVCGGGGGGDEEWGVVLFTELDQGYWWILNIGRVLEIGACVWVGIVKWEVVDMYR